MNRPPSPARRRSSGLTAVLPTQSLSGPTPWVVAVMTCLAMLGLAAALGLAPAAASLSGQIAGRATIQIVEPDMAARRATVAAVRAALTDAPFVTALKTVPDSELNRMAAQWLGDGVRETGLPLPALIDVDLAGGTPSGQLRQLREAVRAAAPSARVIAHADWLGPVAGLMRLIGWITAAIALLLIAAAAAVAMLSARAALAAQRPTIDVLHLVGATDVQIARLFQRRTSRDTILGAAVGAIIALALTALIGWQLQGIASGLSTGSAVPWHFAWLLLVPPVIVAVAVFTARRAVLRALRNMP